MFGPRPAGVVYGGTSAVFGVCRNDFGLFYQKRARHIQPYRTNSGKVFEKYGWTWGASGDGAKDYGHFEKTDLSNVTQISTIINESGSVIQDNTNVQGGTNTAQYTIVVDAGHGDPSKAGGYGDLAENQADLDAGKLWYTTGTSGTTPSGETWTERETVQKIVDYMILKH